tara:strand:+ start:8112 stop:8315 length:204 start_codon:yes stop_codon:yes gene_type:complete
MSDQLDISNVKAELHAHEVQCEERWKTTFNRLDDIDGKLDRMEQRQIQMGGVIIMFLAGLVVSLIMQ